MLTGLVESTHYHWKFSGLELCRARSDESRARSDGVRAISDECRARSGECRARSDESRARSEESRTRSDESLARSDEWNQGIMDCCELTACKLIIIIIIMIIILMMMIIIIIIIASEGAIPPHYTANCLQQVCSSGPAQSCANQVQHAVCHLVRSDSSLSLLCLTECKSHVF